MEQLKQNKGKQHTAKRQRNNRTKLRTQMLEVSGKEFNITMINTLKTLIGKEDNMQDKMGNFSKAMKTISRSHMKLLK